MKKIIILGLLVMSITLTGLTLGDKVLLRVGDSKLTTTELDAKLEELPPQYKEFYSSAEGKKQIIDNYKKEFLVYEKAKKEGYEKVDAVLEQLEEIKKGVMIQVYLKENVNDKVKIGTKEIRDFYNKNKADFMGQEEVKARHILVNSEEEAKSIIEQLNKGGNFAQLAREYSMDPSGKANGGDLGWFAKGRMVKPFETAAFELKKGQYTKTPVNTQFGWHIISVEDKKDAKQQEFKEVEAEIENLIKQEKYKELFEKIIEEAEKQIKVEDFSEQLLLKK